MPKNLAGILAGRKKTVAAVLAVIGAAAAYLTGDTDLAGLVTSVAQTLLIGG